MTCRLINAAGLTLIKHYEGLRLTAYRDQRGIWTIGWGHTGGVYKGDVITSDQADQLLIMDLTTAMDWVAQRTDASHTSDNQFAAMVSLTFNIGTGAFLGSSVRRLHNQPSFSSAAAAFLLWDKIHVDGSLIPDPGLLNRRQAESLLYLT